MTNPYVTAKELKGLPSELMQQIKIKKSDQIELNLIAVIESLAQANIDKILIRYYHEHNEILDRHKLMSRLYRMKMKGLIKNVPKKKGIYEVQSD